MTGAWSPARAWRDYYAEQSCTAGRNSFFTGMHPLRTGMIPPQLPGSPSYLRPGTPALAWFLRDLGYNTGEFGKNHLAWRRPYRRAADGARFP
jgi:arylsulfatase A-like enzyme